MADLVRVLIIEDHPLYCRAIVALVSAMDGWEVVAACGDATSALQHAPAADVAVLDLGLPDMDGTTALRELLDAAPSLRVLVLTMSEDPTALAAVLRHGAHGYLVKGAEPEDIERGLRAVARDQMVLDAALAAAALDPPPRSPAVVDLAFPMLTRREVEVLDLVADGRSNADIAAALVVSPKTARNHVSNVLSKLGWTRNEAIARARDAGLGQQR